MTSVAGDESPHSMRILIVDDESLNRFLLVHMLEEEGYTDTYEAQSGHEALELAKRTKPDLVLLDVIMPGMSGLEVAGKLKQLAPDQYLPIIFITALDDKQSLIRCLEAGGDDFVSKPFDRHILAAKIRAHGRIRMLSRRIDQQNQQLRYYRENVIREHTIVEHIFSNAIVNTEAVSKFFDYQLTPASDFSGDIFLCERLPNGGLCFMLGDFTGHGLASAIGALPVSRAFQAMARKGLSVAEMAATLNKTLGQLLPGDMFCAAILVSITAGGKRLQVWNGGLPPLMLASENGRLVKLFEPRHMALGILEADEFDHQCELYDAEPGDCILAYSDGVMEASNSDGEMFSSARVEQAFLCEQRDTAKALVEKALLFTGRSDPQDDMTVVMYTVQPLSGADFCEGAACLPFNLDVTLGPDQLRHPESLELILSMINGHAGMEWLRGDLFTVLSEMLNNALEHGLLKLDSQIKRRPDGFLEYYEQRETALQSLQDGWVKVILRNDPNERLLHITISDSGEGFDPCAVSDQHTNEDCFGRGLALLNDICRTVDFADNGRTITVTLATQ